MCVHEQQREDCFKLLRQPHHFQQFENSNFKNIPENGKIELESRRLK